MDGRGKEVGWQADREGGSVGRVEGIREAGRKRQKEREECVKQRGREKVNY